MDFQSKQICKMAVSFYGSLHQEIIAVEELSELIQAISHKRRGREHNIAEEIADVEIMLEQLKQINECHSDVEEFKTQKLERLLKRIEED